MCWGSSMMGFVSFAASVPDYARYHNGFIAECAVAPERPAASFWSRRSEAR